MLPDASWARLLEPPLALSAVPASPERSVCEAALYVLAVVWRDSRYKRTPAQPPLRWLSLCMVFGAKHELLGEVLAAWVRNPVALQGVLGYVIRDVLEMTEAGGALLLPVQLVLLELNGLVRQEPEQEELYEDGLGDKNKAAAV